MRLAYLYSCASDRAGNVLAWVTAGNTAVTALKLGGGHYDFDAGWSSLVARRAHNPKVVGSNPAPATKSTTGLCSVCRHS